MSEKDASKLTSPGSLEDKFKTLIQRHESGFYTEKELLEIFLSGAMGCYTNIVRPEDNTEARRTEGLNDTYAELCEYAQHERAKL